MRVLEDEYQHLEDECQHLEDECSHMEDEYYFEEDEYMYLGDELPPGGLYTWSVHLEDYGNFWKMHVCTWKMNVNTSRYCHIHLED